MVGPRHRLVLQTADRLARSGGQGPSLAALASLAVMAASAACTPDDDAMADGPVETAHLRITTTTENPICAGTAPFLESEVVRIAEALELPLWAENDKLDVRFGEDSVAEVCTQHDPDTIFGCVAANGLTLAAKEVAYYAPHELVHAVRRRNFPLGHPLFEEGLAEILSGSDGFPRRVDYPHGEPHVGVEEMLGHSSADPSHYVWGSSFVSWLWEAHGQETLLSFVNDPSFSDDEALPLSFEDHFGQTLTEADQAWAIDVRSDATWGAPCIPDRTYSLADGPVEVSGDFDCQEPSVYGASSSMALWSMCLDVPETTRVRISFEANHGHFQVLGREPCNVGPAGSEAYRDKYLEAGETLEEDIAGCRFQLFLFSQEPGFPATPYTFRIEEIDP